MSTPIRVETDPAGTAVVTVDHPPLNLLDRPLLDALTAAVDALERDRPRAALLRSEGKVVSGGVDVRGIFHPMSQTPEPDATAAAFLTELIELGRRVDHLPFPTVFAAHGLTLTWAFELALACDLILASPRASFGLIEATVGLTPCAGGPQRLAERVGVGRAKLLVMTAERFGAEELERWGAVDRVLPEEGFDDAVRAFTDGLAQGPTRAHAATKELLRTWREDGMESSLGGTPRVGGDLFVTDDLRGAMASFLEQGHGKATFAGR